ncbi:MAG: BamA/TamA family outer membrane protein [Lewinellaceae bacterium]|nr:BamA/TamA family outer membrane protein [Saprospiraceae bacterium]MCB9338374.1 BamA/TamA family outer membrane protein [Lewinellaceae bacterium]
MMAPSRTLCFICTAKGLDSFGRNTSVYFFKKWYYLRLLFCGLLSFTFFTNLFTQDIYQLRVIPQDTSILFLEKKLEYRTAFPDSLSLAKEIENVLFQLHGQSYLEASFDSLHFQDSLATAWLHLGRRYQWGSLRNGNVEEGFLNQSGFKEKLYRHKNFDYLQLRKLQDKLLQQAENNGYPFAAVRLDSIGFDGNRAEAMLFMEKGRAVFFDSLNVEGDAKISTGYLRSYLGIKPGAAYSRKKVLKIKDRLRELPFVAAQRNATIRFLDDRANLRLYLARKKASRFDFLLGVLPDNQREGNRVLLTGTFDAELQNQFGLGERIYASFERLRPQTQRLELAFAYPYILELPFGVDLKFNQYKRDSTYTDIAGDFGVQYLFEGGNYLKAFWNITSSNLISVDTNAIRQGRFPEVLDVRNSAFGLEARWQKLDYRFNPRRGWALLARGSAGTRQIGRNQAILNVVESFYDTLPGKTYKFLLEGHVERYFPILQRSAVKTAIRSQAILSEAPVYLNEQFRIGGNRVLRGFDEESIFATFFAVFTLEYRFLLGENSYFNLFGDYGYVEDRRAGRPARYDRPLGFGAGLTFETTAGVFGISAAIGKQQNASLDLRNPKIHFGYVSIF